MPSMEDVYITPEKCADLLKLLSDHGLTPSCYAAWCGDKPPAISANEAYMERFQKALRFCVNCGIPYMRVDTSMPKSVTFGCSEWEMS